jgi:hypothetical protein
MWDFEEQKGKKSPADLARVAGYRFEQILALRKEGGINLGKAFVFWLMRFVSEVRTWRLDVFVLATLYSSAFGRCVPFRWAWYGSESSWAMSSIGHLVKRWHEPLLSRPSE